MYLIAVFGTSCDSDMIVITSCCFLLRMLSRVIEFAWLLFATNKNRYGSSLYLIIRTCVIKKYWNQFALPNNCSCLASASPWPRTPSQLASCSSDGQRLSAGSKRRPQGDGQRGVRLGRDWQPHHSDRSRAPRSTAQTGCTGISDCWTYYVLKSKSYVALTYLA